MTQPTAHDTAGPRILMLGLPGSGKTTLARAAAKRFSIEHYELDWLAWRRDTTGELLPHVELVALALGIADQHAWVADGVYAGWTSALAERAHLIVWLDIPLRTALWRIFWRHVKSEIRRDNKFPGWRQLCRFMRDVSRQYHGQFEEFQPGIPAPSIQNFESFLADYRHKVIRCSSMSLNGLLNALESHSAAVAQTPAPR